MNPRYVIIAGCGRLGSTLANRLSGEGHSVVIIDNNERKFAHLSSEFSGFRIHNDVTDLEVLREAKARQADALIAVTEMDNTNLMVAQLAKVVFKVPLVFARVNDPGREQVFRALGVHAISPTRLSADSFLQALNTVVG